MKKILITILFLTLWAFPVFATNTHTTSLSSASTQFWSRADEAALEWPASFTFEIMAYLSGTPTSFNYAGKWVGSGGQRSWALFYEAGQTSFLHSTGGSSGYNYCHWDYDLPTGEWTRISFVKNGSTCILYVDGVEDTSGTDTTTNAGAFFNGTAAFQIGQTGTGVPSFNGYLDDVRVWGDARTSTEISDNYNCSLSGDETDLLHYWRFDNSATDDAGSSDLTANNGAGYQSTSLPFTGSCGSTPATVAPNTSQIIWFE